MAVKKNSADKASDLERIVGAGVAEKVPRSSIKNAPYNPRAMTEAAKKKLRKGIEKHGLVSWPTWNRTSGNLVGGHQRLSILDAVAGVPDYDVPCIVVEMSEAAEKEANVLLNNTEAQGFFDDDLLKGLLADQSLSLEGMGFDRADLHQLFGADPSKPTSMAADLLEGMSAKLREAKEAYAKLTSNSDKRDGDDYYLVVIFKDHEHRKQLLDAHGMEDNRYQDGQRFLDALAVVDDLPEV